MFHLLVKWREILFLKFEQELNGELLNFTEFFMFHLILFAKPLNAIEKWTWNSGFNRINLISGPILLLSHYSVVMYQFHLNFESGKSLQWILISIKFLETVNQFLVSQNVNITAFGHTRKFIDFIESIIYSRLIEAIIMISCSNELHDFYAGFWI